MKSFLQQIRKLSFDILALVSIILLMIFIPESFFPVEARAGLISIIVVKFILVSVAIIHAHITRKLLFHYINFSEEKELTNNIMIIVWYTIIIFAWSRGG